MLVSDSSKLFSKAPATNGGSSSVTFCIPSVIVVLFNQARQPHGLYSAVETGMTFFSLPSFILIFLPPSLAKPGTSAAAGAGRLNVYDAIKSSVVHAATFRARKGKGAALFPGPPVRGIFRFGDSVRPTLSSSYGPV